MLPSYASCWGRGAMRSGRRARLSMQWVARLVLAGLLVGLALTLGLKGLVTG